MYVPKIICGQQYCITMLFAIKIYLYVLSRFFLKDKRIILMTKHAYIFMNYILSYRLC